MSVAFTSPAGQTWQALLAGNTPWLNELTLAYSERRQAISQSAYTPAAGKDVQAASYWTALQNWLETNCTSFIDHVNGPLNPAGTAFLYFTLATWRATAGLNTSGFRRSADWDPAADDWTDIVTPDPMFTVAGGGGFGQMQAGDTIGPWIFEDLQKGFGALKWSIETPAVTEWKNKNSLVEGESCAITKSGSEGEFEGLSWNDGTHYDGHHNAGSDMHGDTYGAEYCCEAAINSRNYWSWNNFRSKVRYTFSAKLNARQCNIYVGKLCPRLGGCVGVTGYNDIDGLFGTEVPAFNTDISTVVELLESKPETSGSVVSDRLWIDTGIPSSMLSLVCPTPWPPEGVMPWGGRWSWGVRANLYGCLSKWNFTNA